VLERIQPRRTTDVSTDVSTSNVNSIDTTMEKETSMAMDVNEIIHVTHAEVVTQRWDPHVQYVIRTRSSHNNSVLFVTRRRARFFTVLHGQLKKMGYKNLPLLPGTRGINLTKIMSGKTFDCGAVQEKRLAYEQYLRELTSMSDVRKSSELKTFLGCVPCSELDPDGSPLTRPRSSSSVLSERSVDLVIVGGNGNGNGHGNSGHQTPPKQQKLDEVQMDKTINIQEVMSTRNTSAMHAPPPQQAKNEQVQEANETEVHVGGSVDLTNKKNHFSSKYIAMLIMEIATLKNKLQRAEDKITTLKKCGVVGQVGQEVTLKREGSSNV
jgi:hypothetical protein